MPTDALEVVALRNEFYKDGQRKIVLALLVSVLINVVQIGTLVYLLTHPPAPQYFATSISGRITPFYPLNEPNQADSAILQWANQAAVASFTYNFVNYRDELQAASVFYTPSGWDLFMAALKESNNLDAVKARKQVVSAVPTRAPSILDKRVVNGSYTWRVQMPMVVTYQSANEFSQQNLVVTLVISRISTLNSPRGIGISQIIVSPDTGKVTP